MRVLVTGAYGYLGGRIADHLSSVDNYSLRLTANHPVAHPVHNAETMPCDIQSASDVTAACEGMDAIVHLAALNENDSMADPLRALRINGLGTLNLLQAAAKAGVKRFVFFSTAHVYGVPLAGHITEHTLPRPAHPYAITHRVAEDFVLAARDRAEIEAAVFRLTNAVGAPREPLVNRWTLLANDLCRQAVVDKKLVLRSTGSQFRDFICMSDVCRAVEHFLRLPASALGDGLFNVGGARGVQVRAMADLIAQRCEALYGYRPAVVRPEVNNEPAPIILDYDVNKLLSTAFTHSGDLSKEIDATLALCWEASRI